MSQHFRLLNEAQVKRLLPMSDLIAAMENALSSMMQQSSWLAGQLGTLGNNDG